MRCVVSDTGPLLHLTEAKGVHLLQLTGDVHVPHQVVVEMSGQMPDWEMPDWLTANTLAAEPAMIATRWQQAGLLDAGEAEAIALAQQLEAGWLLTDDAAARLFASEVGLEVHGSLGVVLWAAAVGHLSYPDAVQSLEQLAASSLWISRRILGEARAALEEMF